MSTKRTLHFSAQGFKTQEIEIAPDLSDAVKSKRYGLIQNEDVLLSSNLEELDIGTKARNRAFQDRLDEVWRSTEGYEAKLRTEAREAVESVMQMKDEYTKHIENFSNSLLDEINGIFNKMDNETLPYETNRLDIIDTNLETFIKDIVPAEIELHSGELSRQLKRAYETFDVEKQKEFKRENKLLNKINHHLQFTCQRFEDEDALMSSCFFTLEDDIIEQEQRVNRMHLMKNSQAIQKIKLLNSIIQRESQQREQEDVEVLDTLIETQYLLQQMILMHFGTKADGLAVEDFPVLEKLSNRMDKINEKQLQTKETELEKNSLVQSRDDNEAVDVRETVENIKKEEIINPLPTKKSMKVK